MFDCTRVADELAASEDPRLDEEYLRCLPGTDRHGPVLLVGVVHDHPASIARVVRMVETFPPDTLALELPPLAMPLFRRYAADSQQPPRLGGEMSAAIQSTDAGHDRGPDGRRRDGRLLHPDASRSQHEGALLRGGSVRQLEEATVPAQTKTELHRFTAGLSTVAADDPLADLRIADPTKWAVWMEDFLFYDVAQGDAGWTFTTTNNVDTIVGPTGVLVMTNGGADNDLGQIYPTNAAFQTNGKQMVCEIRAKLDKGASGDIAQSEMFLGLSSVQTGTNFFNTGGTDRTMDDAIGFAKYDGNATVDCIQGEADTFSVEKDAFTLVDDTWTVFTFHVDADGETRFWVDGVLKATLTSNVATSVLTPMLYVKAGEAIASVLSVDYVLVAAER